MNKNSKIYIAGHNGMVGSAILRELKKKSYDNLITISRRDLDLRKQDEVFKFFKKEEPDFVFLAAARVGGILANSTYPAEFIYDNLMIEANVIHASHRYGVEKLLFLGSSCIYPKYSPQPIKEEYLLSGKLEPTNQPYAIAKIAGIELCNSYRRQYGDNFISVMPTNLYGPFDNFDPETSHVFAALLRKIHEAKRLNLKEVVIWGSGTPKREFLYVGDLANACIFLMNKYNEGYPINIGTGKDISINELAHLMKKIIGWKGRFVHDLTKPDGTPRKVLDVSKIKKLGWEPSISLREGIQKTYEWFIEHFNPSPDRC